MLRIKLILIIIDYYESLLDESELSVSTSLWDYLWQALNTRKSTTILTMRFLNISESHPARMTTTLGHQQQFPVSFWDCKHFIFIKFIFVITIITVSIIILNAMLRTHSTLLVRLIPSSPNKNIKSILHSLNKHLLVPCSNFTTGRRILGSTRLPHSTLIWRRRKYFKSIVAILFITYMISVSYWCECEIYLLFVGVYVIRGCPQITSKMIESFKDSLWWYLHYSYYMSDHKGNYWVVSWCRNWSRSLRLLSHSCNYRT